MAQRPAQRVLTLIGVAHPCPRPCKTDRLRRGSLGRSAGRGSARRYDHCCRVVGMMSDSAGPVNRRCVGPGRCDPGRWPGDARSRSGGPGRWGLGSVVRGGVPRPASGLATRDPGPSVWRRAIRAWRSGDARPGLGAPCRLLDRRLFLNEGCCQASWDGEAYRVWPVRLAVRARAGAQPTWPPRLTRHNSGTASSAATGPGGVPPPKGRPPSDARSWASSQPDKSGPTGTMPLGLMSWWTR